MSDLISRQAAIDMFQSLAYDDWNQGVSTSWADAYNEAAEKIREMPSAEPQIIHCRDCKHWMDIDNGRQRHKMCADVYGDWFCADAERREDG